MLIKTICSELVDLPVGVVMKVAGRRDDGASMMLNVHGFRPSFYVRYLGPQNDPNFIPKYDDYQLLISTIRDCLLPYNPRYHPQGTCLDTESEDVILLDENEAIQQWKCGDGFQNGLSYHMFKLSFYSVKMYKWTLKLIRFGNDTKLGRYCNLQLYDCETDVEVKSLAVTKLRATGWVRILGFDPSRRDSPIQNNRVTQEIDVQLHNPLKKASLPIVEPMPELDKITPGLKLMTFDFEMYSSVKGTFPDANRPLDSIFQISVVVKSVGLKSNENPKSYLLYFGPTLEGDFGETDMVRCSNESALLYRFAEVIRKEDPDIISGHNITGFDIGVFFDRCKLLKLSLEATDFSRFPRVQCSADINSFKSGQVSAIERKILYCPGRLVVDFQVWIERNKAANEYDNYQLETIAQKELKQGKDNVTPQFMFDAYRSQNPKDLGTVANYCVLDSLLVDKLLTKLNVVIQLFAMAYSVNVPVSYLMEKGQTVKTNAQLTEEGYAQGILLPKKDANSEDIEGAVVLDILPGSHDYVVCVDFSSLYPSIMIRHSICPTTIVNDPKYLGLSGVEYTSIAWQKRTFIRKSQCPNAPEPPKIFTVLQDALTQYCHDDVKMKGLIGEATDLMYNEVDDQMGGLKSIKEILAGLKKYQASNAIKSRMLQLMPALLTTHHMNFGERPPFTKTGFLDGLNAIFGKKFSFAKDEVMKSLQAWNETNHSYIQNRVMKIIEKLDDSAFEHKKEKILTEMRAQYKQCRADFEDMLDLAEDESLNLEEDDEDDFWTKLNAKRNKQKIVFRNTKKAKYTWETRLVEQKNTFAANQPCLIKSIALRVLSMRKQVRKKQKSLKGSLDPDDILQYAVYEGQQLAYKVTANSIYGALALRDSRLGASVTAEGRKMLSTVSTAAVHDFPTYLQTHYWTKEDVEARLPDGISPSGEELTTPLFPTAVEGKPYCERRVQVTIVGGGNFHIHPLSCPSVEYLLIDTDSIFVRFDDSSIDEAISLGNKGSDFFSGLFQGGIKMEFEKVWSPYIAIAKKKGIGRKFVTSSRKWDLELKGVETKRRNYCPALKESLLQVFKIILGGNVNVTYDEAVKYVRNQLTDLLNGRVPMEKLLISTKLNSSYKLENLPGLDLVKRMRERHDFNTPEVGARFQFLYVDNKQKKQFQRSEDINYARENSLKPDILYYIEKQFSNPILGILKVLRNSAKAERLFAVMKGKALAMQTGQRSLDTLFQITPVAVVGTKATSIHGNKKRSMCETDSNIQPVLKQQKLSFLLKQQKIEK